MKKPLIAIKYPPIQRCVRSFSTCGSADLAELDWSNWWVDNSQCEGEPTWNCYLHVRRWRDDEGETWHRVYPHKLHRRTCNRVMMTDDVLTWIYDRTEETGQ